MRTCHPDVDAGDAAAAAQVEDAEAGAREEHPGEAVVVEVGGVDADDLERGVQAELRVSRTKDPLDAHAAEPQAHEAMACPLEAVREHRRHAPRFDGDVLDFAVGGVVEEELEDVGAHPGVVDADHEAGEAVAWAPAVLVQLVSQNPH